MEDVPVFSWAHEHTNAQVAGALPTSLTASTGQCPAKTEAEQLLRVSVLLERSSGYVGIVLINSVAVTVSAFALDSQSSE